MRRVQCTTSFARMIYYFDHIESEEKNTQQYRFCAEIESLYYVEVVWRWNEENASAEITGLASGFLTAAIISTNINCVETDIAQLRQKFSSFAYFLERCTEGYRSYLGWIRPSEDMNAHWIYNSLGK
jgi:hypothetical protein